MRALVNPNLCLRLLLLIPKTQGVNIQPLDRDLTSTTSNEGTTKTMPPPEGSLRDKDSGGNIPPDDMEPIHTTVDDPLRTGAKYQVDQTQSTRLRYQFLTENKGEPSYEGEPDTQHLVLSTYADVIAFLLSDDEAQKSEEEILGADKPTSSTAPHTEVSDSDSFNEDILKKYDNTLPLTECQLEKHEEVVVNYADLKASIDGYYDENITQKDQTDKLVEASMSSLEKSHTTTSDIFKGLMSSLSFLKKSTMLLRMTLP
ncbi:hypothetical protein Tco_1215481 [Tanacetum coccineum]